MNKLTFIILFIFLTGCEKILHEPDRSYEILDKKEEKLEFIDGIYDLLVQVHNHHYFFLLSKSDDITFYPLPFHYGDLGVVSTYYTDFYTNLYKAILNANSLILQLDDNKDSLLKGEAFFLRAYCYFKLVRIFKVPPLYTHIDVDYTLPKPSVKQVYTQIENDLLNAIDILPGAHSEARQPGYSPHRGTAKALLAEVYLTMAGYPLNEIGKYALAADLAEEVIDNSQTQNLALLPDFKNLWSRDNPVNTETVFAIYYTDESNSYYSLYHISWTYVRNIVSNDRYEIYGLFRPEFNFYNRYPKNYRKKITFRTGRFIDYYNSFDEYEHISIGVGEFNSPFDPSEEHHWTIFEEMDPVENVTDHREYINYKKYIDETKLNIAHDESTPIPVLTKQVYLLRYAQTLLTYAEAAARSGNITDKAYEAINKIRRRANHVDINNPSEFDLPYTLTPEQFIDSVVWERAWELCKEPEGRWFDIIRLDLKEEIIANREGTDKQFEFPETMISDDWYFVLIPQEDRWLNPNFDK